MRQYVLTRSAFGPEWSLEANARRLAITRAVTAPLMAAQTNRDWTWVVLVDPRDPLLEQRQAVFTAAAPRTHFIYWTPETTETPQLTAYAAYRAPWRLALGHPDETVLQTRLDDDDGLAPGALAAVRAKGRLLRGRSILLHPQGIRVWAGRYSLVRHDRNAMHTLVTPPGDGLLVYDYGHTKCHEVARVRRLPGLGWLWVRHTDAISGWRSANRLLNDRIRRLFPIDWTALEGAWEQAA